MVGVGVGAKIGGAFPLVAIAGVPPAPSLGLSQAATGGVETLIEQGGKYYRVHTFSEGLGQLNVSQNVEVEYLIVGAGGGTSNCAYGPSGGSGRGEVVQGSAMLTGNLNIDVAPASAPIRPWELAADDKLFVAGNEGASTTVTGALIVTAEGGSPGGNGHASGDRASGHGGKRGGGGGGGAGNGTSLYPAGGISLASGDGSGGSTAAHPRRSGGGGGYLDAGAYTADRAGSGGHGILSDITGTPTYYGCGGAGASGSGAAHGNPAPGGASAGEDGQPGTGNGSGACASRFVVPPVGGSGIAVFRYEITQAEYLGIDIPDPAAVGGVETVVSHGGKYYRVHKFSASSASLQVARDIPEWGTEIVAGGGSGGSRWYQEGGGGGAGGAIQLANQTNLAAGVYPFSVGSGGQGTSSRPSGDADGYPRAGGDTVAFGQTALGGAGGGGGYQNIDLSWNSQSGGCASGAAIQGFNTGVASQGYGGGAYGGGFEAAGGGGGMGGPGGRGQHVDDGGTGGAGGVGIPSIIPGSNQIICEGGSGAGLASGPTTGVGGVGGINGSGGTDGTDAMPDTGSGGGGCAGHPTGAEFSGSGSDGYVAVWYEITQAEYEAM